MLLFPLNASNFTLIGSLLLALGMGGVGGVGVGVTKFCNNLFGGGGAWPFLVGGVICLVNSDNERDSVLLNSNVILLSHCLLRGTGGFKPHEIEQ